MTRRTSIGYPDRQGKKMLGNHLTSAKSKVMRLAQNVLEMLVHEPGFTAQEVLNWCVEPRFQSVLRSAVNVVDYYYLGSVTYETDYEDVSLRIDWTRLGYARAEEEIVQVLPGTPIANLLERVRAVRDDWENVMAVLYYFDRNGTPGSARYYWPTILTLAPDHEGLTSAGLGNSFVDPPRYSVWLPSMRKAATTVASALMLPTPEKGGSKAIDLVLPQSTNHVEGESVEWGPLTLPLCD